MFKFKSLKTKLTSAFLVMTLVPTVLISSFSYISMKNVEDKVNESISSAFKDVTSNVEKTAKEQSIDKLNLELGIVDARIASLVQESKILANQIKSIENVLSYSPTTLEARISAMRESFDSVSYAYIGTKGKQFIISPHPEGLPSGYDTTQTDWYKLAEKLEEGKVAVTDAYLAADGVELMVTLVTPLIIDGEFKGVIGVDSVLETLSKNVADITVGETGFAIVTDKKGMVLAHKDMKMVGKNIKDLGLMKKDGNELEIDNEKFVSVSSVNKETGWTSYAILSKKDFDILTTSLNVLVSVNERELAESMSKTSSAKKTTLIWLLIGVASTISLIGYFLSFNLTKPIIKMANLTNKVANGDLTSTVDVQSHDEIGVLANSINTMIGNLKGILHELSGISTKVRNTSVEMDNQVTDSNGITKSISASMKEVAFGSESQTTNMVDVSKIVKNINNTMVQYIDGVANVSTGMTVAVENSNKGLSALTQVYDTMTTIETQSEQSSLTIKELDVKLSEISDITTLIEGIAEQTNLLSLNASIEAARAGDQGKGFAVVANEVKSLAEQSKKSVTTISKLVSEIQSKSLNAVKSMDNGVTLAKEGTVIVSEATEYFNSIISNLKGLTVDLSSMVTKTKELEKGGKQINEAVQEVVAISEQTTANARGVTSSLDSQNTANSKLAEISSDLKNLTTNLELEIKKFTI